MEQIRIIKSKDTQYLENVINALLSEGFYIYDWQVGEEITFILAYGEDDLMIKDLGLTSLN